MASPFSQAWNLLKFFKNPHDEEQGYYDHKRQPPIDVNDEMYHYHDPMHPKNRQPMMEPIMEREMAEMDDPLMAEDSVDAMELAPLARDRYKQRAGMGGHEGAKFRPPNPFEGERGSVHPDMNNQAIEEYLRDIGMLGEVPDVPNEPESAPDMVGDVGRPQTIPMSPRGSVRGKGERQATAKPKKPDWWRTLTGEV